MKIGEPELNRAIGMRMELARRSCGLTLVQAAAGLGLGKSTLSRLERGEAEAVVGVLVTMAVVYGVSTDYLLFGIERYSSCPSDGRHECRVKFMLRTA